MAGSEGVATGIRSVVMSGNRDQIPHLLQVADPVTAENYKLLCVITGRKPLCLKCKHVGHYRRDCTTPYCRHHDTYGHDAEDSSRIRADFVRFDSDRFCKYWCKNNNIVLLEGESIKILLRLHPP